MAVLAHQAHFGVLAIGAKLLCRVDGEKHRFVIGFVRPVFVVAVSVVVSFVICRAVVHSPFGRALEAIRENERRFMSLGRDSRPFKIVVFVVAATFAGLAGALFAPFRGFASPEVMFWVMSGQGLMMVITGGIGTLIGPIIGAMVFILVQEILSSYTTHWMIGSGAIFVLMVIFLPGGIVGTVRRLAARA